MKTITPKNKFYFLNFNKTLALAFIFSFFAIACNKNDDIIEPVVTEPEVPIVTNPLFKTWKLVEFIPPHGISIVYTNAEIQWTINDNNTIDVVIANGTNVNGNLPLKEIGSYSYTITNNTLGLYNIYYNQYNYYNYEIVNNQLIIVQTAGQGAGGKVLKFD